MTPVTVRNHELKIPPVLVALIFALLMWQIASVLPGTILAVSPRRVLIVLLIVAGVIFSVSGVVSFKNANTTVNPLIPGVSSSLVTSGIYRLSRNPMYLGFLFFLLAWGVFLSNLYSILFSAGFVLYMNRFQIRSEERALLSRFGEEYSRYISRVRRWL
jgi:protein-S-isoprenylcysteine O-methyltransferase Ste14